jgi:chaperonin cofactor prefoldin
MSSELIGILGVGVALAGLIVASFRSIRGEVRKQRDEVKGELSKLRDEVKGELSKLRDEVKGELSKLRDEVNGRLALIDARLSALEKQQAKLEGLLEGLREAMFGRRPA